MNKKRLVAIVKLVMWTGALVGAVRKVLSFSRGYMLHNIGHEHMYPDRVYICIWMPDGSYIFLSDIYNAVYKGASISESQIQMNRVATRLNYMVFMQTYDWFFVVRRWTGKDSSDPRYRTMRLNDVPSQIMGTTHRFLIWKELRLSQLLYSDLHVPSDFGVSTEEYQ